MSIRLSITLPDVVDLLNEALQADPQAMSILVAARVPCNEVMAGHPTIQVGRKEDGQAEVGLIGILNGLFGVDDDGWGAISAYVDLKTKMVTLFNLRLT